MARIQLGAALVIALLALLALPAAAHFHLDAPASLTLQNAAGTPQKAPPCGPTDIAAAATGDVTDVMTGSLLTITITETVTHPGHYRVALAPDVASLPANPPVTQVGSDPCGSTQIDPNPTLPILADGLLAHNSAFSGPQSMQVQLPAGMQCTNCILQVIQYMRSHSAPCFYHHCAALNISDTAPPPPPPADGGMTPGDDAGVEPGEVPAGGCCSSSRELPSSAILLGVLAVLLLRRRS